MRIVGLQLDITWEDKGANFDKTRRILQESGLERDTLVILPEMFATGFSMDTAKIAEPYDGETEQFLASLAKQHGVYVVAGAAMRGKDGRARNKALVFAPTGELIGFYAKMKPFSPGGESDHYAAGDGALAFRWGDCTVAPFICYDLRFPELFRKVAATNRPELFVVIASWPEKRIIHWTRLLQARAIENQAYVVGVNRVGTDPFYTYTGRSIVVDYNGDIIADAGTGEERIEASLDLESLRRYRHGLPFLNDLQP